MDEEEEEEEEEAAAKPLFPAFILPFAVINTCTGWYSCQRCGLPLLRFNYELFVAESLENL
jgi:hypothetical protein